MIADLTKGVSDDLAEQSVEEHARWLIANMLEWHRREDKAGWWEYFRLIDLNDEELLDERGALSGLEFVERVEVIRTRVVDRYRFPPQETSIREDDDLKTGDGEGFGEVVAIDLADRTIDIKKHGKVRDLHPSSVFEHRIIRSTELADSLHRLGRWIVENGVDSAGLYRAGRDLLLRKYPRLGLSTGLSPEPDGEEIVSVARRLALHLSESVLPIQGPPGAGKTYTGARMICELVRNGKKVGVTAVGHKVIRNLLDEVQDAAQKESLDISIVQKITGKVDKKSLIREVASNDKALEALADGEASVVGGTAWLWAPEKAHQAVDVLFVDEAGQMSLADVLAVSQAAHSLVLLGDPQQLEQPQQGAHPQGTDASALEHILGGEPTMPPERGLFLSETWRLHPELCRFTSEVFYEDRLSSHKGLDVQTITGHSEISGPGLYLAPVHHTGNQNASIEEAERVQTLVESLTKGDVRWTDQKGIERPLSFDDILIVAPYNAHVTDISMRIPGAKVGTVDRFQGQEGAVVIYSMATSSPEDAPRGMEFLYSLNRLNVASSRARCACVLVANTSLFEPDCRTPRQMKMANAFCRYREMATVLIGTGQ